MRKKVRKYETKKQLESRVSDFFKQHRLEVIDNMMKNLGYSDFDTLMDDERSMKIDYCGFVWLEPRNKEQRHEWFLDNDRITDYASPTLSYNTQIIALKRSQLEYAIDKMGLDWEYKLYERLD